MSHQEHRVFSPNLGPETDPALTPGAPIENAVGILRADEAGTEAIEKGRAFAREITERHFADFEKSEPLYKKGVVDAVDQMVHVSTFHVADGTVFMTYYANTSAHAENPDFQTARLAFWPVDDPEGLTVLDVQTVGDEVGGERIVKVYDTILMPWDEDTLYILWTAATERDYYRFYRTFSVSEKRFGEVGVNRFRVGDVTNDFSASGIKRALAANGLPYKTMYSDIGIMQKLSFRMERGEKWYYSGTYSGDFTAIIKSRDLVTWEYVAQPDFPNESKWENATYVLGDRCFYFVRQQDGTAGGFLTYYDLESKTWAAPLVIEDCQSRGDFIYYEGELYLFHAPIDREHIGIVHIDTEDIARSRVLLQAKMDTSCFYPFVTYFEEGELAMSYTVSRKHIRLGRFTMRDYL